MYPGSIQTICVNEKHLLIQLPMVHLPVLDTFRSGMYFNICLIAFHMIICDVKLNFLGYLSDHLCRKKIFILISL
jgi:hypothetical protein